MKKFVVVPMNRYRNVLPKEIIKSGSEKTALKTYLKAHRVPFTDFFVISEAQAMRWISDGNNRDYVNSMVDFLVDSEKGIEDGVIMTNKRSNAYHLV